jgi:hypothetical protein
MEYTVYPDKNKVPSTTKSHTDLPLTDGFIFIFLEASIGVGVGVIPRVGVGVGVGLGVGLGVGVGVNGRVGVGVGVGVGVILYANHPMFLESFAILTYLVPSAISIKDPICPKTIPSGSPCSGIVRTFSIIFCSLFFQ